MSQTKTAEPTGLVEMLRDLQDNVHGHAFVPTADLARMERQAAGLLAALERMVLYAPPDVRRAPMFEQARAAIARAKGEKS